MFICLLQESSEGVSDVKDKGGFEKKGGGGVGIAKGIILGRFGRDCPDGLIGRLRLEVSVHSEPRMLILSVCFVRLLAACDPHAIKG